MDNPNPETRTDTQPETVTPQPVSEPTVTPTTEPAPVADPIDYKQKFADSTREAQVLASQLEIERAKNRRDLTNQPTDSDLQAAIPGWEYMDEGQKAVARLAFNGQRIASGLAAKDAERESERQWNTDLELAIAQNPSLQGKEQAFKEYANKPTHRNAPISVLIDGFKGVTNTPSPMNTPTPATPSGLEQPNGGPRGTEQPRQLDADQLKTLRETDERAYNEYVRTHDIDIDALLA